MVVLLGGYCVTRAAYDEARVRCAQEGFLDELAVTIIAIGLHFHDRTGDGVRPPEV